MQNIQYDGIKNPQWQEATNWLIIYKHPVTKKLSSKTRGKLNKNLTIAQSRTEIQDLQIAGSRF